MTPTWTRVIARCSVVALAACGAAHEPPGVDPRAFVDERWGLATPEGHGDALDALMLAVRQDACAVGPRAAEGAYAAADDALIDQLVRLSEELCAAGVSGAPLSLDPLTRRRLDVAPGARVRGEGYLLLGEQGDDAVNVRLVGVSASPACVAPVDGAPSLRVRLMERQPLQLESLVNTELRVEYPDGSLECVAASESAPSIGGAPGLYRVWAIGSERVDVRLRADRRATPGQLVVSPGGPPVEVRVSVPRTSEPATAVLGEWCAGFVSGSPTTTMLLRESGYVAVSFRADAGDGVLVVEGEGETHCNDDADGLDPAIRRHLGAGTWRVYVGTFTANRAIEGTLRVE